ncbi:hypothetical protein VNO77_43852 [Canavalia gladiata]|uniref:Uncharacterized protein n=1 Tax=Canavalia gladiata TaxID=3824 RepID=A0AAN9JX51_CANGL
MRVCPVVHLTHLSTEWTCLVSIDLVEAGNHESYLDAEEAMLVNLHCLTLLFPLLYYASEYTTTLSCFSSCMLVILFRCTFTFL